MSIGTPPLGFGQSASRFPNPRKDPTPGPGSYEPKPMKKPLGGSFSKAERFPSKHDVMLRQRLKLEIKSIDSSEAAPRGERRLVGISETLDRYFQPLVDRGLFNGQVLVMDLQNDDALTKGYGRLVDGTTIGPDTPMPIGSNTKQLTAGGIMVLQAMGYLDIHHKVAEYLPDFPHADMTIEDLLTHHSGLTYEEEARTSSPQDVEARRGTFEYSNSGYRLLSEITVEIGKRHGLIPPSPQPHLETWNQFMIDNVFKPLGMENTSTVFEPGRRQWGYEAPSDPTILVNPGEPDLTTVGASGNGLTTARDWKKWTQFLHGTGHWRKEGTNRAVGEKLKTLMAEMSKTHAIHIENGHTVEDGYGLRIETINGHSVIGHGGINMGILSESRLFKKDQLMIFAVSNVEDTPLPKKVIPELHILAKGGKIEALPGYGFPEPVPYDAESMRQFEGTYYIPERAHPNMTVSVRDGHVVIQSSHPGLGMLPPQNVTQGADGAFSIKQGLQKITFQAGENDSPPQLIIETAIKTHTFIRSN